MLIGSSLVETRDRDWRPPTVLWSVVSLGLLSMVALWFALGLGAIAGATIHEMLSGESFAASLAIAAKSEVLQKHKLLSISMDAIVLGCGGYVAARHALHAPRLHGFLVAAICIGIGGLADDFDNYTVMRSTLINVAMLVSATLGGELASRWPGSSRSALGALLARRGTRKASV